MSKTSTDSKKKSRGWRAGSGRGGGASSACGVIPTLLLVLGSTLGVGPAQAAPGPCTVDPARPDPLRVEIPTSLGVVVVELWSEVAPCTVNNFLAYVESGRYDGTFIHRTVDGFVVQGGGFFYDTAEGVFSEIELDPPVPNEPGVSNLRGTIAMARLGGQPDSATSRAACPAGPAASTRTPCLASASRAGFGPSSPKMEGRSRSIRSRAASSRSRTPATASARWPCSRGFVSALEDARAALPRLARRPSLLACDDGAGRSRAPPNPSWGREDECASGARPRSDVHREENARWQRGSRLRICFPDPSTTSGSPAFGRRWRSSACGPFWSLRPRTSST